MCYPTITWVSEGASIMSDMLDKPFGAHHHLNSHHRHTHQPNSFQGQASGIFTISPVWYDGPRSMIYVLTCHQIIVGELEGHVLCQIRLTNQPSIISNHIHQDQIGFYTLSCSWVFLEWTKEDEDDADMDMLAYCCKSIGGSWLNLGHAACR